MLSDSNIIIYSSLPQHNELRTLIVTHNVTDFRWIEQLVIHDPLR